jgi:hypothetical protein
MFVFANVKLITIAIKTKIKIYQIYLIMKIKAFYSLFSLIILNYLFISYNNLINIKLIIFCLLNIFTIFVDVIPNIVLINDVASLDVINSFSSVPNSFSSVPNSFSSVPNSFSSVPLDAFINYTDPDLPPLDENEFQFLDSLTGIDPDAEIETPVTDNTEGSDNTGTQNTNTGNTNNTSNTGTGNTDTGNTDNTGNTTSGNQGDDSDSTAVDSDSASDSGTETTYVDSDNEEAGEVFIITQEDLNAAMNEDQPERPPFEETQ